MQGICSGDTLVFKRDVQTGHIELSRIAAGAAAAAAARMEEVGGRWGSWERLWKRTGSGNGGGDSHPGIPAGMHTAMLLGPLTTLACASWAPSKPSSLP